MPPKRRKLIGTFAVTIGTLALALNEYQNDGRGFYTNRKEKVTDWWASSWGKLLKSSDVEDPNSYAGRMFRRRFRLPFRLFQHLVEACKAGEVFGGDFNAANEASVPVEIKVLGALRTLGRGTLHDDVAEMTGASLELHRQAFVKFISFIAKDFREEWIRVPEGEDLEKVMKEYTLMGFPGAIGSMDATHVHWNRCPSGAKNMHNGKEGYPSRVFNVAVTHHGRVFSIAEGQPGARNDKCIVRFDDLLINMREKGLFADLEWKYFDKDGVEHSQKGAYLISDNGYHQWVQFCCPIKLSKLLQKACDLALKPTAALRMNTSSI